MSFNKYAKYYDLIYKDKPYKKEADFVYKWANKPKTILELGGGTGGHAKYWKDKAEIKCVDMSEEMAYQYPGEVFLGDVRTFDFSVIEEVDAVFAMFNVVGYADLIYYLDKLPLRKGGYFIFDCWDTYKVGAYPPITTVKKFGDYARVLTPVLFYHPYLKLEIKILAMGVPLLQEYHIVRHYPFYVIDELAMHCGFKVEYAKSNQKEWTKWYRLQKIRD